MSVALREPTSDDFQWLDTWLPSAAKAVGHPTDSSESLHQRLRLESRLRVRIIVREGAAAGLAIYALAPDRRCASFELVATPPEHARRGAGIAAATLVEHEMIDAAARTAYAPAPATHGISMYFWIRLGYAPLIRTEWPCEQDGVAWLRRMLVQS